jgi:hypothetical protein
MGTRRKSIKLLPDERKNLMDVYVKWRFAIDAYEALPDELEGMIEEWRQRCGRNVAPDPCDILHYMRTQRKLGRWVKLGNKHRDPPAIPSLSAEDVEKLVDIYASNVAELDCGSDTLAYDEQVADFIAREFADRTGHIVPAPCLVAKLTALRKRGLLPRVTKRPEGFRDIGPAQGQ